MTVPVASIPELAVIIPIESTFVTSSYVRTPATLRLPLAFMFPTLILDTQA